MFDDALDNRKPVYTREGNVGSRNSTLMEYEHWKKQQSVEDVQRRTGLDFRNLPQMYRFKTAQRQVCLTVYVQLCWNDILPADELGLNLMS